MAASLSRRGFIVGAAALAATAACGNDNDNDNDDVVVEPGKDSDTSKGSDDAEALSTVIAGSMFQTDIDERVAFALFEGTGTPPSLLPAGKKVLVAFGSETEKRFSAPVEAVRHADGIEERPYFVVRHRFASADRYVLRAVSEGYRPGDATIQVHDPAAVAWPVPGKPLPKVKSPTTKDALGIEPICTRTPSACPWHEQSLDAVLGNGKPTVVILSTPALCQSAVCGPVLEILLGEQSALAGKANTVHIEVFADKSGKTLSPAFAAFKTDTEPVLYLADGAGIMTERFVGPFDRAEARAALTKLVS